MPKGFHDNGYASHEMILQYNTNSNMQQVDKNLHYKHFWKSKEMVFLDVFCTEQLEQLSWKKN